MAFQVPTRDALLACRRPVDLFGADGAEARALRAAWATLARAFRGDEDPEAFAHARALYEAARDGAAAWTLDEPPTSPPPPAFPQFHGATEPAPASPEPLDAAQVRPPATLPPESTEPTAEATRWLRRLLDPATPPQQRATAAMALARRLVDLPPEDREQVLWLTGRVGVPLSEQQHEVLVGWSTIADEIDRARAAGSVPPPLLEVLVAHARGEIASALRAAHAWVQGSRDEARRAIEDLHRHSPTLAGQLGKLALDALRHAAPPPPGAPAALREHLRLGIRVITSMQLTGMTGLLVQWGAISLAVRLVTHAVRAAQGALGVGGSPGLVAIVLVLGLAFTGAALLRRHTRAQRTANVDAVFTGCAATGVFPLEAEACLAAEGGQAVDRTSSLGTALIQANAMPARFLLHLDERHLARLSVEPHP